MKKIVRKTRNVLFIVMYYCFCILPLRKEKILFTSESREEISGNLKYIYTALEKKSSNLNLVIRVRDKKKTKPSIFQFANLAFHCATSSFIIIDDFYPILYKLKIRKKANFMQVWHAVGAFKQFGYARVGLPGGPKEDSINHRNYTQVIISSANIVDIYAKSFGVNPRIVLPLGVARTDFFFNPIEIKKMKTKFYEKYPKLKDKKIVMFAPTFRGNGQMTAYYPQEWIDLNFVYEKIKDTNYIFALKFHPYVKDKIEIPEHMRESIIDFSEYREINDLLIVSERLITDYSSSIFEYSLMGRKMLFYVPDLDEYTRDRSFYFEYEKFVPGNIHFDFEKLVTDALDEDFNVNKIFEFRNKFFEYQDGKSSERISNYILENKRRSI
jgi:Putative glycosyl/glycerophosphate transferases involved in teichoic acid biosynthesis TagF/TagB/EpsJ/RodC